MSVLAVVAESDGRLRADSPLVGIRLNPAVTPSLPCFCEKQLGVSPRLLAATGLF